MTLPAENFQKIYLDKFKATYEANYLFFQKNLPHFITALETAGNSHVEFDINDQGKLRVGLDGNWYSEGELIDDAKKALNHIDQREKYIGMTLDISMSRHADRDIASHILDYYYDRLYEKNKRNILDLLAEAEKNQEDPYAEQIIFDPDHKPILICFGTGLGWHVEALASRYQLKHLILIDTDPSIAKLSLFFVDYVRLFHQLQHAGCHFSWFIDSDAKKISDTLLSVLLNMHPPYAVNGMFFLQNMRHVDTIQQVKELMLNDYYRKAFMGWGFIDDEILSMRHSLLNFARKIPLQTTPLKLNTTLPAFVVGAGPSLDGLLPLIRSHQNDAFVISCGTALRVLLAADITPDLHIEIERPYSTYEALLNGIDLEKLRKIPILGLNVLYPEIFDLTDSPLMFLKGLDCGTGLLKGRDYHEFITTPSVTNAGLSFAMDNGFSEVYLMGVDVGFVTPKNHHAKNTIYHEQPEAGNSTDFNERMSKELSMTGFNNDNLESYMRVPGNFREEVFSTFLLNHTKEMIEYFLNLHKEKGANVYNPNDGAKIQLTTSIRPEDIQIAENASEKTRVKSLIMSSFDADYPFDSQVEMDFILGELRLYIEAIKTIAHQDIETRAHYYDILTTMYLFSYSDECQATSVFSLVRGCMNHYARMIYDYAGFLRDDKIAIDFAKKGILAMVDFLEEAHAHIAQIDLKNPVPAHILAITEMVRKNVGVNEPRH